MVKKNQKKPKMQNKCYEQLVPKNRPHVCGYGLIPSYRYAVTKICYPQNVNADVDTDVNTCPNKFYTLF